MAMSVSCGEVWGSQLLRIFLHSKSGIPISRMYVILFSILWHISGNFSYYYAGVMLDAHESLLCSKLCQHNVDNPIQHPSCLDTNVLTLRPFHLPLLSQDYTKKTAHWTSLAYSWICSFTSKHFQSIQNHKKKLVERTQTYNPYDIYTCLVLVNGFTWEFSE